MIGTTRLKKGTISCELVEEQCLTPSQTIPNNGSCFYAIAERSKGIFGLLTRWVGGKISGLLGYMLIETAMTASQMRIAETIDAFYGDAGAKDGVSRSYKQAVEDLDAETIKALDGPYRYGVKIRTWSFG